MDAPVTVFDCKWASRARPCQDMCRELQVYPPRRAAGQLPATLTAVSQWAPKAAVHTARHGILEQAGETEETFLGAPH